MKHLIISIIALALVCSIGFAQDDPPAFSWEKTIELQPGETADLVALSAPGFNNGWAEIAGTCEVNGTVTTFVSWCANSTVQVKAVTACTLVIRGTKP